MTAAPATKAAATASVSHNVLADMITGIETKINDGITALKNGTANAAGASDKVTAAIGSVSSGVDAAKHLATLALNVRSGNFSGAAKDAEAILGDVSTILGKFGVNLPLLTEANSLLVKYIG